MPHDAKPLANLEGVDTSALRDRPETGMGYQLIAAALDDKDSVAGAAINGRTFIPVRHANYYTLMDLIRGLPVADQERTVSRFRPTVTPYASAAPRPPAVVRPPTGAVALVGSGVTRIGQRLYRLVCHPTDARYGGGTLSAFTYLTTKPELTLLKTGFGVVGRLSLPIPRPAIHIFEYEFHAATPYRVGTVAPLFGQSGGGVEIQIQTAAPVRQTALTALPAY